MASLGTGLGLSRVAPGGAAAGAATATARALVLVLHGQSNARSRGTITTASVPSLLSTFNGGSEKQQEPAQYRDYAVGLDRFAALAPYSDPEGEEGVAPGFAIASGDRWQRIVTYTSAVGRQALNRLTPGSGPFQALMAGLTRGFALATEEGYGPAAIDVAVLWDHGEADALLDVDRPSYLAGLRELRDALDFHWLALTGNGRRVPILTTVPTSAGNPNVPGSVRAVQAANMAAHDTLAGVHLLGPRYAFAYESDVVHMAGDGAGLATGTSRADEGKRPWGEYVFHRVAEALDTGATVQVRLADADWTGTTLTLTFVSPSGAIAIDESNFYNRDTVGAYPHSSMGVELIADGAVVSLLNPSVAGSTVNFDTASAASGAAIEVRIAQQEWPGGNGVTQGSGADPDNLTNVVPRTCICDAVAISAPSGPLRHWAVPQTWSLT